MCAARSRYEMWFVIAASEAVCYSLVVGCGALLRLCYLCGAVYGKRSDVMSENEVLLTVVET